MSSNKRQINESSSTTMTRSPWKSSVSGMSIPVSLRDNAAILRSAPCRASAAGGPPCSNALSASASRTLWASSSSTNGLLTIRASLTPASAVRSAKPVTNSTGKLGRFACARRASSAPFMPGMAKSAIMQIDLRLALDEIERRAAAAGLQHPVAEIMQDGAR